jgi:hypothetical protein
MIGTSRLAWRPVNQPLTMFRHHMRQVWNWTAQHNEVAMLLFALIPWMLFNILTSVPF